MNSGEKRDDSNELGLPQGVWQEAQQQEKVFPVHSVAPRVRPSGLSLKVPLPGTLGKPQVLHRGWQHFWGWGGSFAPQAFQLAALCQAGLRGSWVLSTCTGAK